MKFPYADILEHPYPFPTDRPRMDRQARAAQFAPFAALTGYSEALAETARLTSARHELTEEAQEELNEKLLALSRSGQVPVTLTYFLPDTRKSGGDYRRASGIFRQVDTLHQLLWFTDHRSFCLGDIADIQSPVL